MEIVASRHNRTDSHITSGMWRHTEGLHRFKPDGAIVLRYESEHKLPSLTDIHLQQTIFSPVESYWIYKPHIRVGRPQALVQAFFCFTRLLLVSCGFQFCVFMVWLYILCSFFLLNSSLLRDFILFVFQIKAKVLSIDTGATLVSICFNYTPCVP